MTDEPETWRRRAAAMAKLLRPDLADADWDDAMRVMGHVGMAAKRPAVALIAKRATGASALAPQGVAVRRSACRQLLAACSPRLERAAA